MRAPEICFNFVQLKDVSGGLLSVVNRRFNDTAIAGDTLTADLYDVKEDQILIVTSIAGVLTPKAGGAVTAIQVVTALDPTAGQQIIQINDNFAADRPINLPWSGEVWVPPGGVLRVSTATTGGAGNSQLQMSWHGFAIPRGNVQRG